MTHYPCFCFFLIMEVLSRILRNIEEGNLIRGFHARAMNYVGV